MLRPGLNEGEVRGGMKEETERGAGERERVGNKGEKSKVSWKKRSWKELRKRWAEGDFPQSHRLFAAVMFNYFWGLGIRGFSGNSHLSVEDSKWNFNHWIISSPFHESDTLRNKTPRRWKLGKIWWCGSKLRASPLNDLNLSLSSMTSDDTTPCLLKNEKKGGKRWGERERRQTDESRGDQTPPPLYTQIQLASRHRQKFLTGGRHHEKHSARHGNGHLKKNYHYDSEKSVTSL